MIRSTLVLATAAMLATPAPAQEAPRSPEATALGTCLTAKSTGEDRIAVARWLLGALASLPQVSDVAAVKPEVKATLDKGMARVFTRLLAVDCAAQTRALFATGSTDGFRIAGESLGAVAMGELLGNPGARDALGSYTKYLNKDDFKAVLPVGK